MYRIGIDLGGINIACGLVDNDGNLVCKRSVPTFAEGNDGAAVAAGMVNAALNIIGENGLEESDISVIGIGIPGAVDRDRGFVIRTANVPLDGFDLAAFFAERTSVPIRLDNDANCAALGEAVAGAAKGVKNCITVTLGTGVGGGIIIDGKIYSGFNFAGGEMGHMVTHLGGRLCGCGRRGCFETYASATAIINDTREAMRQHPESKISELVGGDPDKVNGKTVFDAAEMGDETAKQVVENYIVELGDGIVNYVNIFQPEVILLGGGIANQGEKLLVPLRQYVGTYSYGAGLIPATKILKAALGNDAGIIGAAML